MTSQSTSTQEKTPGLAAGLSDRHRFRQATVEAAFLLPHLKPGMSLLDVGCGPGSITLGLAEAVAPGNVVGIDVSAERVDEARALADERGIANVTFEVGDAVALGFEEASFDAAFEHSVFMHVVNPGQAAREVFRVLKPGGVFGASDADASGFMHFPYEPFIATGMAIQTAWRLQHGGDNVIGKSLRGLLHEVGFARSQADARFENGGYGNAADIQYLVSIVDRYFQTQEMIQFAKDQGLGDDQAFEDIRAAWARWSLDPGAFWADPQIQAVGWKPDA